MGADDWGSRGCEVDLLPSQYVVIDHTPACCESTVGCAFSPNPSCLLLPAEQGEFRAAQGSVRLGGASHVSQIRVQGLSASQVKLLHIYLIHPLE